MLFSEVKKIAMAHCRYPAVDISIINGWSPPFGPAHELGHLLLSTEYERSQPRYGMPDVDDAVEGDWPAIVEVAASIIHTWIAVACISKVGSTRKRKALWSQLRSGISPIDMDMIAPGWWGDPETWQEAKRLLSSRGITRTMVQEPRSLAQTVKRTLQQR